MCSDYSYALAYSLNVTNHVYLTRDKEGGIPSDLDSFMCATVKQPPYYWTRDNAIFLFHFPIIIKVFIFGIFSNHSIDVGKQK